MREIDKYHIHEEKLQGICDENNLTFKINNKGFPFTLVIKPLSGMDAQQTMMEGMETPGDTGYISPDASLVFAYRDGDLTYKISETWTIGSKLFDKLKNKFRNLHDLWMQYFYRDVHENSPSAIPGTSKDEDAPSEASGTPEAATPDFVEEDPGEDPFAGFMDAEDAEDAADAISTLTDISALDDEDV